MKKVSVYILIGAIAVVLIFASQIVAVSIFTGNHGKYRSQQDTAEAVVDLLVSAEVVLACDKRGDDSVECYFERWR